MKIRAMTGSEIAREMDISRQAVSQSLKRAVMKVYTNLQEEGITDGPIETIMVMRQWFDIEDDDDLKEFYDIFPKKVREEIRQDAILCQYIKE